MVIALSLRDFTHIQETRFGGQIARQEMRLKRREQNLPLISAIGFFNYLPIFISVYSLMFHSIERFLVIRSVHRSIRGLRRFSIWSIIITWIVGISVAIIPVALNNYGAVSYGIFVITSSDPISLQYGMSFFV